MKQQFLKKVREKEKNFYIVIFCKFLYKPQKYAIS